MNKKTTNNKLKQKTKQLDETADKYSQAKEALKDARDRYRILSENITDLIWTTDLDFKLTYISPSVSKWFGSSPEEALNMPIEDRLSPESLELAYRTLYKEILREESTEGDPDRTVTLELEFLNREGEAVWTESNITSMRDKDGNPIGLLGISRNITKRKKIESQLKKAQAGLEKRVQERTSELMRTNEQLKQEIENHKRTEEVLRESEKRYKLLAENINDVIWTSNLDFSWSYISPSFEKLTGFSQEEAMARPVEKMITPESLRNVSIILEEELKEGRFLQDRYGSRNVQAEFCCKDGSTVWVEVNTSMQLDENDNPIGLVGVSRDITERKQTEEQLLQSEKMAALGGLVAGVSHEISTPLGVGVMSASYLKDLTVEYVGRLSAEELEHTHFKKYAPKAIEASSLILTNLERVTDLLSSFKQVAVDQSGDEKRVFDLETYLNEILLSLKPKYNRTRHTITVNCPKNFKINTYPGAFSQIITNLVINSLIHGFEGVDKGNMSFHVSMNGYHLLFCYSDNGVGMNKNTLNRLFEPFFTTKRGRGGSGLGMHIVYNLVTQKLGGQIECVSSLGTGAEFSIRIPLNQTKSENINI